MAVPFEQCLWESISTFYSLEWDYTCILVDLRLFLYSNKTCMQILQQHMRAGLVLHRALLATPLVESTFCCEVRWLHIKVLRILSSVSSSTTWFACSKKKHLLRCVLDPLTRRRPSCVFYMEIIQEQRMKNTRRAAFE
jgi:hypothetical protein